MKGMDSISDSFRIRLICTILDTLGRYFQRSERKKLMDRFLMYFQRYIFSKTYVLMDLEFMVLDTFDTLRPALIRFQSLDEADQACQLIEDRESKAKDFTDILGTYQTDGGGYDHFYDEDYDYYGEDYYGDDYYPEQEKEDEEYYEQPE